MMNKALLIFIAASLFPAYPENSRSIEFKSSCAYFLPDGNARTPAHKAEADAGIRARWNGADARLFLSVPKTALPGDGADILAESVRNPRFGLGIEAEAAGAKIGAKAGTNTFSDSLSKIRNPTPSAIANPLAKSLSLKCGTGTALPTLTSAQKPLSATLSATSPSRLMKAEFMLDEEMDAAASFSACAKLRKNASLTASLTASRFFVENGSATLKKAGAQFDGKFMAAAMAECALMSPVLKAVARFALHESPFGPPCAWMKLDGRTAFGNVLLDASFFSIPTAGTSPKAAPLIGQGSSVVRTTSQLSLAPQILLEAGGWKGAPSYIRLGLCAMGAEKVAATKSAEKLGVGKIRAAAEWERGQLGLRGDFTAANILISGNPTTKSAMPDRYDSFSLSAQLSSEKIRAEFSAGAKFRDESTEFSASFSASPGKSRSVSVRNSFSAEWKDGGVRSSDTVALSFSARTKSTRADAKFALTLPF